MKEFLKFDVEISLRGQDFTVLLFFNRTEGEKK